MQAKLVISNFYEYNTFMYMCEMLYQDTCLLHVELITDFILVLAIPLNDVNSVFSLFLLTSS